MPDLGPESRPALRDDLALIPLPGGVQLRAGDEEIHVLSAPDPPALLALLRRLDGTRTLADLCSELAPGPAEILRSALDPLAAQGLVTDGAPPATGDAGADEVRRYLGHFPEYASAGSPPLRGWRVRVAGHAACVGLLSRCLAEHGIAAAPHVREGAGGADPAGDGLASCGAVVCAWERPDVGMALAVNAAARRAGVSCLFVDLSHGRHATLGPFYVPGEGACYACFRHRLRQNTSAWEELSAAEGLMRQGGPLPGYGLLPAFRYQLAGMAAAEVLALRTRHRPLRTLNRIVAVDFEGVRTWSEPAWRVPWCDACGTGAPDFPSE